MAQTINVKSTVTQADSFAVEVEDSVLLSTRYFPNGAGDNFVGKEVLFDFDESDLAKGAFMTTQYANGRTTSWRAAAVIPPRVANSDTVDPKGLDRQMFERLCRVQGADLNRSRAFQDLLVLKSSRLAKRTDRAIEVLDNLVLSEGKIEFDQAHSTSPSDGYDHISVKYYDPLKGPNNHWLAKYAWSNANADPYHDICDMVTEGIKHGRRYSDLLLGSTAWAALSSSDAFQKFAGATFHSEGMVINFGDIDSAQHVARAVFNGIQLNVIVYSGAYRDANGVLQSYINPNAAILISENVGRLLCGGCTLLRDDVSYDINACFVDMLGKHCQSIYKDLDKQELTLREESRPLPAPRISVNEMPWIYCDTSIGDSTNGGALGEIAYGIKVNQDEDETWTTDFSDITSAVIAGKTATFGTLGTVTSKTVKLYAMRCGAVAEEITISTKSITVPIDNDRDANGNLVLYATVAAS